MLVLERGSEGGLVAVANLSPNATALPPLELAGRRLMLSTEDVRYGGSRAADQPLGRLFPYELLVLGGS